MADLNPQQPPQFEKAEYLGQPGANSCAFCKQSISNQYYRIGGGMACPSCAMQIQRSTPVDSHGAFVRALLFGAGGAVLGLVLFAGSSAGFLQFADPRLEQLAFEFDDGR